MRHTWLAATLIALLPTVAMAQNHRGSFGGGFRDNGRFFDGGRHFDHDRSHNFFGLSLGFNFFDYPSYGPSYYSPMYYSPAPVVVYSQPTYYTAPPAVIYAPAPVIISSPPVCNYYSAPRATYYGSVSYYGRR